MAVKAWTDQRFFRVIKLESRAFFVSLNAIYLDDCVMYMESIN